MASNTKLEGILQFLDNVESDVNKWQADLQGSTVRPTLDSDPASTGIEGSSAAITTSVATSGLLETRVQLEEKNLMISRLRAQLDKQRTQEAAFQDSCRQEVQAHKTEAGGVLAKNMQLVNSLLADKEALGSKCTQLAAQLSATRKQFDCQAAELQEQHQEALQNVKKSLLQKERKKRADWQKEHEQKIKDRALKSLEPDVTRLINRHIEEKVRLEEERNRAVKLKDLALHQLRDRHSADLEAAVQAERDAGAAEMQRQRQADADAHTQQSAMLMREKETLAAAFASEQSCLKQEVQMLKQHAAQTEQRQQAASQQHDDVLETQLSQVNAQHARELEALRAQITAQHAEEMRKFSELNQAELSQKYAEQRDAEIALVVGRFEKDIMARREDHRAEVKALQTRISQLEQETCVSSSQVQDLRQQLEARMQTNKDLQSGAEKLASDMHDLRAEKTAILSSSKARQEALEEDLASATRDAASHNQILANTVKDLETTHMDELEKVYTLKTQPVTCSFSPLFEFLFQNEK
eukprot:gene11726-321_t